MSQNNKKQNIVLCEGKDDEAILRKIAETANIGKEALTFEIYEGKDKLKRFLLAKINSGEFTSGSINRILITRDADDSWENSFISVKNILIEMLDVQIRSCGEWTKAPAGLDVAVWIAPGAGRQGMIETLCLEAARQDYPDTFSCLDAFADCVYKTHECELHEKERFAIWSIAAQNNCFPRRRLSIPKAINNMAECWENSVFHEIRNLLKDTASDTP